MAMSPYCRVKRVPVGTELKAGTLLAINGCWQNKAEIAYINMVCVHDQKPYAAYSSFNADSWAEFAVGIRTLGRFYADGREQIGRAHV